MAFLSFSHVIVPMNAQNAHVDASPPAARAREHEIEHVSGFHEGWCGVGQDPGPRGRAFVSHKGGMHMM